MYRPFYIFPLFFLLFSYHTYASDFFDLGQPYFETVGDNKVIPEGIVMTMAQDNSGFIWIGTQEALVRYDGYRFKQYIHNPDKSSSISGSHINTLWIAPNGKVWAGTESDGISIYNANSDSFTHLIQGNSNAVQTSIGNRIYAVTGDEVGNAFVGSNNGLHHVDIDTGVISKVTISGCANELENKPVTALLIDRQQFLWIGSSTGLCRIKLVKQLNHKHALIGDTFDFFQGQEINSIFEASNGFLWLGTRNHGAALYKPNSGNILPISDEQDKESLGVSKAYIRSIIQVNKKEIWLGSYSYGIIVVNAFTGTVIRNFSHDQAIKGTINGNRIGHLLLGKSGLVWVGIWGGGVNSHNPTNNAIRTLRHSPYKDNSLSNSDISSLHEFSSKQLWVGNSQKGVDIVDKKLGAIAGLQPRAKKSGVLPGKNPMAIVKDADGNVWLGMRHNGLVLFNPESREVKIYTTADGLTNNRIYTLHISTENILWIGTDSGLNALDFKSKKLKIINDFTGYQLIENKKILSIATLNNKLWIGTTGGLYVLSTERKSIIEISHSAGTTETLADNYVHSLLIDSKNQLWLGTDAGIDKLFSWDGKKAIFESINKRIGKQSEDLGGNLLEDQFARIWTDKGFIDTNIWHYTRLDEAQGWDIGTQWYGSYLKMKDGLLLYGGTEGLLMVRPELWQAWNYEPPLVLSSLTVNNQEQPIKLNNLSLPANSNSFSVEFSALDYSAPENNKYAYKLEGFDEEWIHTDAANRRASYTNLPPGDYTLKVKGTNRNGQWSQQQITLPVTQIAAWYQTLWFRLLVLTLVIGILYGIYILRINVLKRQKEVLNNIVKTRTESVLLLNEIGKEITSNLNFEMIIQDVYRHVNKLMDATIFGIGIYNAKKACIEYNFSIENGQRYQPYTRNVADKDDLAVQCLDKRKTIFINNIDIYKDSVNATIKIPVEIDISGNELIPREPNSLIYIPLQVDNKVLGLFSVQSYKVHAYTDYHIELLQSIASYTAIAIDNSNVYKDCLLYTSPSPRD